jgi:uncharacterized membrane protein (DUF485 family)
VLVDDELLAAVVATASFVAIFKKKDSYILIMKILLFLLYFLKFYTNVKEIEVNLFSF